MRCSVRCLALFRLAGAFLALMWLAGGCGFRHARPQGPPLDEQLQQLNRAARLSFEQKQIEQAADLYRKALERAIVRADLNAIVDARYNLAACLMESGQYRQALDQIASAQSELSGAGRDFQADLHLLRATILYRDGKPLESWQETERIIASGSAEEPILVHKTYFLRGLISAEAGDAVRVREALPKLGTVSDAWARADRAELTGRLFFIQNNWDQAIAALDEAAGLRRLTLNYRRMAIALALSAEALENAGRPKAAAMRYLQAGRSAALNRGSPDAQTWLVNAIRLSGRADAPDIAGDARAYLEMEMKHVQE